MYICVRIKTTY